MDQTIEVKGVRYRVDDRGTGPVILFVHGFPLDHTMWAAQIAEFSKTHRTISPDLRGFGGSDGHFYSVSMTQFADDLADLLDVMQVDGPVTFCGLSMGGYIAWPFVLRHSTRLCRLILCDTRAAADTPEHAANRLRMADLVTREGSDPVVWATIPKLFAAGTVKQQPDLVERTRRVMQACSPVAIAAAHRGMAVRPDMTSYLPSIRVPTLIVVGEQDAISPAAEMKSIADAIPNAQFALIADAGHMAPLENPVAVNAAIRQFISAS